MCIFSLFWPPTLRSQLKRLSSCPFGWVKRDLGGHLGLESIEGLEAQGSYEGFPGYGGHDRHDHL